VVNDYDFKPNGDVVEGKAAAAELVEYFKSDIPEVRLSLWLEDRDNPLHHYHITVFDSLEALGRVRKSDAIKRFVDRLFPHIAHTHTFRRPRMSGWPMDLGLSRWLIYERRLTSNSIWLPSVGG
jgi:hypothetical protein